MLSYNSIPPCGTAKNKPSWIKTSRIAMKIPTSASAVRPLS